MNEWLSRVLVPVCTVAAMTMMLLGVSIWRTFVLVLVIFGLLTAVMIFVNPGPASRGFLERLKSRLR